LLSGVDKSGFKIRFLYGSAGSIPALVPTKTRSLCIQAIQRDHGKSKVAWLTTDFRTMCPDPSIGQ
jgi:hypothetical protein